MMRCRWCGHRVQRTRGEWLTVDGLLCSPTLRGPICVFWFYRTYGIDPLRLSFHDSSCTCQGHDHAQPHRARRARTVRCQPRRGPGDPELVTRMVWTERVRRPPARGVPMNPQPPTNVRAVLVDGTEIPIAVGYVGFDAREAVHVWTNLTPLPVLLPDSVRMDVLPAHTAVVLGLGGKA